MIGLIQRVSEASVRVDSRTVGQIGRGLLVLLGVEKGDDVASAQRLLERILSYRVFPDAEGRMNLSLADIGGGLLLVPQFTLAADTTRGTRPSFSSAAPPQLGKTLFDHFVGLARARHAKVETGVFGADMKVNLVNDGPVTFWLQVGEKQRAPRKAVATSLSARCTERSGETYRMDRRGSEHRATPQSCCAAGLARCL